MLKISFLGFCIKVKLNSFYFISLFSTYFIVNYRDSGVDLGQERWHVDEFSDSFCAGECN